jgi:hypothetical protein
MANGLPWVEIDTNMPRHPKSIALGVALGDERAWTHVVELILHCGSVNASGKFVGKYAKAALERAAGWRGQPGAFAEAAFDVGFVDENIDGDIVVHGWEERATAHVAKRERDAERQRIRRERIAKRYGDKRTVAPAPPQVSADDAEDSEATPRDVTRMSRGRAPDVAASHGVTVTGTPTGTETVTLKAAAEAPPARRPGQGDRRHAHPRRREARTERAPPPAPERRRAPVRRGAGLLRGLPGPPPKGLPRSAPRARSRRPVPGRLRRGGARGARARRDGAQAARRGGRSLPGRCFRAEPQAVLPLEPVREAVAPARTGPGCSATHPGQAVRGLRVGACQVRHPRRGARLRWLRARLDGLPGVLPRAHGGLGGSWVGMVRAPPRRAGATHPDPSHAAGGQFTACVKLLPLGFQRENLYSCRAR